MKKENIILIIAVIIVSIVICLTLLYDNYPERKVSQFESILYISCLALSPFAGMYMFFMQHSNIYMFILFMIPFVLIALLILFIGTMIAVLIAYAFITFVYQLTINQEVLFIDYQMEVSHDALVICLIVSIILDILYVINLFWADMKSDNSNFYRILTKFKR